MRTQPREHGAGQVIRIAIVFASVHSLLAARPLKELVMRRLGARWRYGLYRFAYVVQSALMLGWAIRRLARLPDRELYHVRLPWSLPMIAGQVAMLGLLLDTIRTLGAARANGLSQLRQLLSGGEPQPEPEAQGPALRGDGALAVEGPFRYTRHPGDLSAIGMVALVPRMTVNRAALALLVTCYSFAGALHEERRLRRAYGAAYERYRREVPFMIPRPRHYGRAQTD